MDVPIEFREVDRADLAEVTKLLNRAIFGDKTLCEDSEKRKEEKEPE